MHRYLTYRMRKGQWATNCNFVNFRRYSTNLSQKKWGRSRGRWEPRHNLSDGGAIFGEFRPPTRTLTACTIGLSAYVTTEIIRTEAPDPSDIWCIAFGATYYRKMHFYFPGLYSIIFFQSRGYGVKWGIELGSGAWGMWWGVWVIDDRGNGGFWHFLQGSKEGLRYFTPLISITFTAEVMHDFMLYHVAMYDRTEKWQNKDGCET